MRLSERPEAETLRATAPDIVSRKVPQQRPPLLRGSRGAHRAVRRALLLGVALAGTLSASGCYYTHLAWGQARVLWARQSVAGLLEDPHTPAELARQLRLVQETREFAAGLGLEVARQYTSFVPWPGDRVVTIIVSTRPGEVEAAGFQFPLVGRVPYKGFFSLDKAQAEARRLGARGHDVCVVPVATYSTLGWTDDPVTAPMLRRSDGELVELVLHELFHATVFAKNHAAFNEGAASFIGEEAAVRFFHAQESAGHSAPGTARAEQARIERNRIVAARLLELRDQIEALYAEPIPPRELDSRRLALEQATRAAMAALEPIRQGAPSLSERVALNDACLALRGTYAQDVPEHEHLLASLDGDLSAYVRRLRAVAEENDPRRAFFGSAAPPFARD